jgi:hypothetical protein
MWALAHGLMHAWRLTSTRCTAPRPCALDLQVTYFDTAEDVSIAAYV